MSAAITATNSQRQRIIRRFKQIGATAPQRAIDPATHHIRQSLVFEEMLKDKVLIPIDAHHYYLDEARASEYGRRAVQGLLLLFIIIVIALAVLAYFLIFAQD
ncbi:MAG: hypothetical protein ACO1NX_00800 [Chitinophagaceae bacterium]